MKYWGKKPHNIWRELINSHTEIGDIVYDPFAGSALTFFEAIKIGRKPVIADINPLTLFLVDLYSQNYNEKKIINRYFEIEYLVKNSKIYNKNYTIKCSNCNSEIDIFNYRNEYNRSIEISYKCPVCKKTITQKNSSNEYVEKLKFWKPKQDISKYSSTCDASIRAFGGNDIKDIWSKRNLEILSYIFNLIKLSDESVKKPLMFAFLQTLHLTTKMCALRSQSTNRPLSTSWGRPAFMFLNKNMEQNPLIQFKRALIEKNGVLKALKSRNEYLPKYKFSTNINDIDNVDGVVLLKDSKLINNIKAKMIITDPPYGSIIQYGELSMIWNVWLENFDEKYVLSLEDEIIIKRNNDYLKYKNDMQKVFYNCSEILSKEGTMIMTFNSNNIKDWECINNIINNSNFNIEKKYKQKNKRSSEANVLSSSDLANSDYYFILKNNKKRLQFLNKEELIAI
ncbi:MAG: hypothetical protein BHW55_02365 [Candidatus Melainabacteria bacterium 35_41]|nr:MAG: hypothetical protein BHW55_02365 [Candidatus Melainabacteria bacterium 35_41]